MATVGGAGATAGSATAGVLGSTTGSEAVVVALPTVAGAAEPDGAS